MEKKKIEVFEQTIPDTLFDIWKSKRRKKDSQLISEAHNICRPVIDRALNFGHVKKQETIDAINSFFSNRDAEEAKNGTESFFVKFSPNKKK